MKKNHILVILAAVLLLALCVSLPALAEEQEGKIPLVSAKFDKIKLTVSPGGEKQLLAWALKPRNANDKQWVSSDESVVTVDQNGLVKGNPDVLKSAKAWVTLVSNGKTLARCLVTVKVVPVSSISLSKTSFVISRNRTVQLTATPKPLYAVQREVTWTTSDPTIVKVDQDGVVHPVNYGTATITASTNDGSKKKDTIKITVKAVRVKNFIFAEDTYPTYLDKGDSILMETKVLPANASFKVPVWTSSDESVLKVDPDGTVHAVGGGIATVTATVDGGRKKLSQTYRVCEGTPVMIKISAAGDVTLGGDPRMSSADKVYRVNATFPRWKKILDENGGDPGFVFKNVKEVFEKDDVSIINLECALTESSNYSKSAAYVFRGSPSYATAFKSGSIEAVCLANNMNPCCGKGGVADTKKAIEQYTGGKTVWFGSMLDENEQPCLIKKKGVTIGLIGFTQSITPAKLRKRFARIRPYCDVLVVYFHWTGQKHNNETSKWMMNLAHVAVDAGADLVLGAHQHFLAGIEIYNGVTICYGLGNFVEGGKSDRDSMIYQQEFAVYDGFNIPKDYNIIPCGTTDDRKELNKWQPIMDPNDPDVQKVLKHLHTYSVKFKNPGI